MCNSIRKKQTGLSTIKGSCNFAAEFEILVYMDNFLNIFLS